MDLAFNNLQRLICHKTQQTKPNQNLDIAIFEKLLKWYTPIFLKSILVFQFPFFVL